jgi:hypothetical protein
MTSCRHLSVADLADGAGELELDPDGAPLAPYGVVELDPADLTPRLLAAAVRRLAAARTAVLVGHAKQQLSATADPLLRALSVTVVSAPRGADDRELPPTCVGADEPEAALAAIGATVRADPLASLTLRDLLRVTTAVDVVGGLVAESFAYSMLLAGPEFARWRAAHPPRLVPAAAGEPVLLTRDGRSLEIRLNRPDRRNAFGHTVRDALVEALALPLADETIERVLLVGNGPAFCSGGDLDEFGTTPDVATAHQIRLRQAAGLALHRLGDRAEVTLHGACVGAGIEIPAFASVVRARADVEIVLPELSMGLVPGAGGTVSLSRRIGRWRTEYLALTGRPIGLRTALAWGLVDAAL